MPLAVRRASSRIRPSLALVGVAVALIAIACGSVGGSPIASAPPGGSGLLDSPGTSGNVPSRRPSASASVAPTRAPSAFPSTLPGLTGWTVVTPQSVDIAVVDGTLRLTLTRRALWFQNTRGVLVGQPVTGGFRIEATVAATDRAGRPLGPRTDGVVQLGGLMARADNAVRENYVFVVVGTDADGLSVETKTTHDSESRFSGPAWPEASADLLLCRDGATFSAWKRAAGSADPWEEAASFDRPDLPATLLVGPNIYANATPDLVVTFAGLRIEPLAPGAACLPA